MPKSQPGNSVSLMCPGGTVRIQANQECYLTMSQHLLLAQVFFFFLQPFVFDLSFRSVYFCVYKCSCAEKKDWKETPVAFNRDGGWYLEHGREKGRLFILVTPNFFHQILMLALPPWGDNFKHLCFQKNSPNNSDICFPSISPPA